MTNPIPVSQPAREAAGSAVVPAELLQRALRFVTQCADQDRPDAVACMMEIEHVLANHPKGGEP